MKNLFVISVFFALFGCAAEKYTYLPDLEKMNTALQEQGCTSIFPEGEWQFVHSIDFTRGSSGGTTVIGITTLSADTITSALVTVEGFTLFEAVFFEDGSFRVERAVPPFNSRSFAEGMMEDIRAIFRLPSGTLARKGRLQQGAAACRYSDTHGRVTDILPNIDDCWQITSYTPDLIMDRSITGRSCREHGSTRIPEYLELQTYGRTGYTLKMTLLRADRLQ